MPEKKQQNETILEQEKRKLATINELAPVKANVSFDIFLYALNVFSDDLAISILQKYVSHCACHPISILN